MTQAVAQKKAVEAAPSRGRFLNSGNGPCIQPVDIGHPDYVALIEPESAFWVLVPSDEIAAALGGGEWLEAYREKQPRMAAEMQRLRFGLKPSAVYFNATERCNLNCTYCYIPETMRRSGIHMSDAQVKESMAILDRYFDTVVADGQKPQIIFHGAEPLLNRDAIFAAIDAYAERFLFGVQTNATLLDDSAIAFLRDRNVSIGVSLDAPTASAADRTRMNWEGDGVYQQVLDAIKRLEGYPAWSVICTISSENVVCLPELVEWFHANHVPTCLLNVLRCTLPRSRTVKPTDEAAAQGFIKALDRTRDLYRQTGRKLIVGNFANILLSIVAPSARRLMCDISPCGGGRCFFALAPNGDLFPCSEFIGLPDFKGGNLFTNTIPDVLDADAFRKVTTRQVENIDPCNRCAIRHFCGSPCPAEAHEMNGGMDQWGAFCEFYEEQVRYAFRLVADGLVDDYLWDGWQEGLDDVVSL
jgi:uncharacterized protein